MPFFIAQHSNITPFLTFRRAIITGIATAATLTLTSCGLTQAGSAASEEKTISLIVTETPRYQEPTEIARELLAEEGWELETTYVTDIIQPNETVSEGEFDANFFQHAAYLRQFNDDNNTEVEPAFSVFYSPSGIFSLKYDSLEALPDGATLSIPVDRSNNGRALHLFAQAGLIEVDESVEITELSQSDITTNPKSFEFIEVDQQSSARTLPDVDAAFAFGSSVVEAGYEYDEVLLNVEEHEDFFPFTVFLSVAEGERDSEKIRALQEAYQSAEVAAWFDEYMDGVNEFSDVYSVDNIDARWNEFNAN